MDIASVPETQNLLLFFKTVFYFNCSVYTLHDDAMLTEFVTIFSNKDNLCHSLHLANISNFITQVCLLTYNHWNRSDGS